MGKCIKYFTAGMAMHALTTAMLQEIGAIVVTPGQQGLVGLIFLGIAAGIALFEEE